MTSAKKIFNEPFEHYILDNPFPDDLYRKMLKNLPEDRKYTSHRYAHRSFYDMSNKFWTGIKSRLIKEYGSSAIVRLFRDKPGYNIGPHTDGKGDIHTILFYLTEKEEDAGTAIYVPKVSGFTSDGSEHLTEDKFVLVKKIPYKPNTALGFSRSDNSFHGVQKCDIERNLIILVVK